MAVKARLRDKDADGSGHITACDRWTYVSSDSGPANAGLLSPGHIDRTHRTAARVYRALKVYPN